ncbi:MAG: S8 family serine peptidase [Phycisphaeraceae bacterium]|nr:S8 family serine peptidase [Phycisphaeraceae bacterium]MCW5762882.1 S8 family serine peptidase [Phycisphaeraceae bacterium]
MSSENLFKRLSGIVATIVTVALSASSALGQAFVPGEILVRARPGAMVEAHMHLSTRGLVVAQVDPWSGVKRVLVPIGAERGMADVLSRLGAIEYAELNGIGSGGLAPDDTFYAIQWHLKNTGQSGGLAGADVDAEAAWEITTGSASIGIAVLDSGIRAAHPEFAGRLASNGWDFVNNDDDPEDDHGHGTWVTGVIAANANNTFAVAGLDWSCTIVPIKVLNQSNAGTTFNLAQGLNYAAAQANVHIINLSLINYPGNATMTNALQGARNAGKILIACAGNNGIGNADVSFPGASPLTISIGATTRSDARWASSGTGQALDFVAPGASIATVSAAQPITNTRSVVSGCSFATPIASAIASLVLARSQELSQAMPDQAALYLLFLAGADDQVGQPAEDTPGWDEFHGWGRLNARRILRAIEPCIADFNGDSNVDFFDVQEFLSAFALQDPRADLNGDGALNFFDVQIFLGAFAVGCP